jgi:hypothetical protein
MSSGRSGKSTLNPRHNRRWQVLLPVLGVSLIVASGCEEATPQATGATDPTPAPPAAPVAPAANAEPQPDPAPQVAPAAGPALRFADLAHDFGRIWDTQDHPCSFRFTNTGDAPLRFLKITSSCTCTLASLDKWQYAPGESGAIATTFEPTKAGPQTQMITILTNDQARPVVKLRVIADVRQFISFDTKFVRFGQVERYHEYKQQFGLLCAGEGMVIEGIKSGNPYVSAEILETDSAAGRALIEVTLRDDAPWGIIRSATLDCTVSGRLPDGRPVEKTSTLRAIGTVLDEIHADLYSMSVGLVPPGGAFQADVTVYHVDRVPFELVEASIKDARRATMDVAIAEDNQSYPGGYRLTVTGRAGQEKELILGVLEFIIRSPFDPVGSVRQIPIIGKVGVPGR